jgi:hypothetical protein
MGMFDSFMATCPDCGKQVEFQSKAGDCLLNEYTVTNVPAMVACDLDGDVGSCECGRLLTIYTQTIVNITIV